MAECIGITLANDKDTCAESPDQIQYLDVIPDDMVYVLETIVDEVTYTLKVTTSVYRLFYYLGYLNTAYPHRIYRVAKYVDGEFVRAWQPTELDKLLREGPDENHI